MFYVFSITVPASTLESDPEVEEITLAPGEIHQVEIGFPWGCAGLTHVTIHRHKHQMWPTNPDADFAWNDYNHVFEEAEECRGLEEHWSIRCWNEDTRHDHTVQIRIGIIPVEKTIFGKIAQSLFGGPRR